MGRHHRQPQRAGNLQRLADIGLGAGVAGALDFEVEGVGNSRAQSAASFAACSRGLPSASAAPISPLIAPDRHSSSLAAPSSNHSRRISARLHLVLQIRTREQAAQLTVALTVLADQEHTTGLVALELVLHPASTPMMGLSPLSRAPL